MVTGGSSLGVNASCKEIFTLVLDLHILVIVKLWLMITLGK